MSRSGYVDDLNDWALIRWRGAVTSALRGARGQAMLRELAAAMDAMPEKVLIANELEAEGDYCALGVLGAKRGISLVQIDPDDREQVAEVFGIAPALAAEIVFENDECGWHGETPAQRWSRMRQWVQSNILPDPEVKESLTTDNDGDPLPGRTEADQ